MDPKDIINSVKDKIGEMFYVGPKGVIGIDIGLSAVKVAEVLKTSDGNYKINRYASVSLPEGAIIEDRKSVV